MSDNSNEYRIYYRRNGFVVPYVKYNGEFWSYIFRRMLAFVFDNMLLVLMTLVLYYTTKFNIWSSMLMGVGVNFLYIMASISMKNNRSLGMIIGKLRVGNFEGGYPSTFQLVGRAILMSFSVLPFIGWFIILFSMISILLTKGLSPIDLMSKTQIFETWKLKTYIEINNNIIRE